MSNFKTLRVSEISVPKERSRKVDEDYALIIQASIVEVGQITPVMVKLTPNGKKSYELVAGGHRHRAIELLGDNEEIDCIVVSADKALASILEVSENLFGNDLNALDRAIAIQIYRDAWEEKHGKVSRGNPSFSNSVNITELVEEEASKGFSQSCADRLGFSKSAIEKSTQIAKNLPKTLRAKLQGTPIAENQSQLLKLAQLAPELRNKAAKALDAAEGDFAQAVALLEDKPIKKPTRDQQTFSKLVDAWSRANEGVRNKFMKEMNLTQTQTKKD